MAGQGGFVRWSDLPPLVQKEITRYGIAADTEGILCSLIYTTRGLLNITKYCNLHVVGPEKVIWVNYVQKNERTEVENSGSLGLEMVQSIRISNHDLRNSDSQYDHQSMAQLELVANDRTSLTIEFVSQSSRDRVEELVRERIAQKPLGTTTTSDSEDLMMMLHRLHKEKLITDDEYDAAKRKLLARLGL